MVTYAEVVAELTAEWNALVIALPSFRNGQLQKSFKYPKYVFISIQNADSLKSLGLNEVSAEKPTLFSIQIIAANETNLNLFIKEIRRILLGKYIAGGWWRVIGEPQFDITRKRAIATLLCRERLAITKSSWN